MIDIVSPKTIKLFINKRKSKKFLKHEVSKEVRDKFLINNDFSIFKSEPETPPNPESYLKNQLIEISTRLENLVNNELKKVQIEGEYYSCLNEREKLLLLCSELSSKIDKIIK